MKRINVAIKVKPTDYAGVIALAKKLRDGVTGNAPFATTSPTLAAYSALIVTADLALEAWINVGRRGSPAVLEALQIAIRDLYGATKQLSESILNIAQTACGEDQEAIAAMVLTTNLAIKSAGGPIGRLDKVRDFRVVNAKGLSPNQRKFSWKNPENAKSAGNRKINVIFRGLNPPVFSTAAPYANTTKNFFIETNRVGGTETWCYWIVQYNAAGAGVESEVIVVTIPSA